MACHGESAQAGRGRCPCGKEVVATVRDWLHVAGSAKDANIRIPKARFPTVGEENCKYGQGKPRNHVVVLDWD